MATCAGEVEQLTKGEQFGGYDTSPSPVPEEKTRGELRRQNSKAASLRRSDSSYVLLRRLEEAGAEWRDVDNLSDDQSHSPDTDVAMDASTSPCKRLEVERDRFVKLTEFGPVPTFPRILCVSRRYLRKNKYVDITGEYHIDLIQDFGGAPIILPRTTRTIQQLCEHLPMDGLVIAEGNDLSDDILLKYGCNIPERLTGEAAQKFASDTEMDVSKDELEFALMRFALAAGVPILSICRGSQLLNCMRGGTLIGDIESQTSSTIKHMRDSSEPDYDSFRHPIKVEPNTPLAEWFADSLGKHGDPNMLMVNSYHHQASKDLGWSLVPMAHSPDGIIEAFYDPRYDPKAGQFVVGLQFHPERMQSDYPGCVRCYQSFLEACSAYKASRDTHGWWSKTV
ncbi:Putative glutamine amidotransferase GAT1_2.1 (Class I glutamine amidotransferase) (GAT1_2 domain-containing protein 1) [Durusdinium trenchii]|uniref:Glutamine amidotransferase GAT1_2.1 (Class I glutamine amidotransferase) (GAT1_2 domain-containing protein 1) n=1 Tax=Durusdinium trenchii TaxID=1381693 RepID=A0ABP0PFI4_9DINO